MANEIEFKHGAPENTDSVWEAWINDRHFIFKKNCQNGDVFLYSCESKTGDIESVTSFFCDRNLTPEEVEALPQFVAFIAATM
jgi:hypothetical protein